MVRRIKWKRRSLSSKWPTPLRLLECPWIVWKDHASAALEFTDLLLHRQFFLGSRVFGSGTSFRIRVREKKLIASEARMSSRLWNLVASVHAGCGRRSARANFGSACFHRIYGAVFLGKINGARADEARVSLARSAPSEQGFPLGCELTDGPAILALWTVHSFAGLESGDRAALSAAKLSPFSVVSKGSS